MNILRVSIVLGFLPLLSVFSFSSADVANAQWFRCPSGYSIQTNNSNTRARCLKPEQRQRVTPDAGCPIGTVLDTDRSGNTDYCVPATGTVIGTRPFTAKCASNQEVERRRGRDRCYTTIPSDVKPVNIPIN